MELTPIRRRLKPCKFSYIYYLPGPALLLFLSGSGLDPGKHRYKGSLTPLIFDLTIHAELLTLV
jgi:hypothetical protein